MGHLRVDPMGLGLPGRFRSGDAPHNTILMFSMECRFSWKAVDKAAHDRQDLRERIFARGKADLDRTRWSRDWPPVSKALLAERPHNPWREVIREAECG